MTRRASLPGADELFRANTPALSAVRQVAEPSTSAAPISSVTQSATPKTKKGVRTIRVVALLPPKNLLLVANFMKRKLLSTFPVMNSLISIRHV